MVLKPCFLTDSEGKFVDYIIYHIYILVPIKQSRELIKLYFYLDSCKVTRELLLKQAFRIQSQIFSIVDKGYLPPQFVFKYQFKCNFEHITSPKYDNYKNYNTQLSTTIKQIPTHPQILSCIKSGIQQLQESAYYLSDFVKVNKSIRHYNLKIVQPEMQRNRTKSEQKSYQAPMRKIYKSQHKQKAQNDNQKIIFLMVSDSYMGVQIPFKLINDQYRNLIKGSGGIWDPNYKIWKIPKEHFTTVRTEIPNINPDIVFEDPPDLVTRAIKQPTENLKLPKMNKTISYDHHDRIRNITQNPLYQRLYPFQRETLQLSVKKLGRLLIGDEMGVGKTIQSLACAIQYIKEWPLLIICPSALKLIWFDQIGKWLGRIISKNQVQVYNKSGTQIKEHQIKILIISYQLASKIVSMLNNFKVVIADEAHYLKNSSAQRTQNLMPFLMTRKRIFLLTGTPALAKPRELYNLASIIRPDIYINLKEFGQRYCKLQRNPWTGFMEYEGSRNSAQLYYILKDKIMIRRMKADVLQDLPEKQRQVIMVDTDKAMVKQIKQLLTQDSIPMETLRNSEKLLQQCLDNKSQNSVSVMPRCYQLTGMAKLQATKQYIHSVLQNDVKVLIFAHHKIVMDQLQTFIKSIKIGMIKIDGEISLQSRQKKVKMFQDQQDIRVALLSITCAGLGYTLTSASTVIFAQLHWTPAMLIQAEDRAHRIGQKAAVNAHYLIGQNTLDPILYRALQRKLGLVGQILNGNRDKLGAEDLQKGKIGRISVSMKQQKRSSKKITDYFKKQEVSDDIDESMDQDMILQQQLRKRKAQFEQLKASKKKPPNQQ